MVRLIDSGIWIALLRGGRPPERMREIGDLCGNAEAFTCEPVVFELTRGCNDQQLERVMALLENVPVLPTPPMLWTDAASLSRRCRKNGFGVPPLDLLIAQIAILGDARLYAGDAHFRAIAQISTLKLEWIEL